MKNFNIHPKEVWLVVYTNPRAEKKVAERIEKLGVEVFCPLYTEVRQWSDRKKKVELPLIPSVVFVRMNPKEESKLYTVSGFVRFLKIKGDLAVVKDHEIENLKIICREWNGELIESEIDEDFSPGVIVKVVKGPFKGAIGESVMLNGKHRLKIRIDVMQSEHLITLPKSFVKKEN
jgi:transcription antitermination factor NusG